MELQHFSHEHPLIFLEELSRESDDDKAYCLGCGELLLGPSFSCVACEFYLHKQCAEAPTEMNLSFHTNHNFTLFQGTPYENGSCWCDFCDKRCEYFVYHCSCGLDFHIKCALFSHKLAEKRTGELQHIGRIDPLISTENHGKELNKAECFLCWKPLLDSEYLSPDSGFYLHVQCVDLPSEINHLLHHDHPLLLQFNNERLPCDICQKTQRRGFVYCCQICKFVLHVGCATLPTEIHHFSHSMHPLTIKFNSEPHTCQICDQQIKKEFGYCCPICKFDIHIECAPSPPTIQHKNHPHTFQLLKRRVSYICDACGTLGNYVSYTCHECNIMVHRKCISLPRAIKFHRHHHPLSHNYFLENDEVEMLECGICRDLVKSQHGSYFCSKCNYIVHVNCALRKKFSYHEVDPTKIDELDEDLYVAPYSRVTETSISHFNHHHDLEFSEDITSEKQCDGCMLFISTSYYYCLQCDFFLHESCVELPLKKHLWFHYCQNLLKLTSDGIFKCSRCQHETSGFNYKCDRCRQHYCVRCVLVSDRPTCEAHEHPLPLYNDLKALCNACGVNTKNPYRCKRCNFNLDSHCLNLPLAVKHKSDPHLLKLTYGDNNDYSEYHYCDICEKKRNPNNWFYYCAICDTTAHPRCVVGKYSFIKLGSFYTKDNHSHPLTFVHKVHFYPKCHKCNKPCIGLALECNETGCGYIIHRQCSSRLHHLLDGTLLELFLSSSIYDESY